MLYFHITCLLGIISLICHLPVTYCEYMLILAKTHLRKRDILLNKRLKNVFRLQCTNTLNHCFRNAFISISLNEMKSLKAFLNKYFFQSVDYKNNRKQDHYTVTDKGHTLSLSDHLSLYDPLSLTLSLWPSLSLSIWPSLSLSLSDLLSLSLSDTLSLSLWPSLWPSLSRRLT